MKPRQFPFEPKSALSLEPGDFWGIPLSDGSYACGRIIQLHSEGGVGSRTGFLAGLLNWHAPHPPTSESIAGAPCCDQGGAHIRTILENGRFILGHRPLGLDGIEPRTFWADSSNAWLVDGLSTPRARRPGEPSPGRVFPTWGFKVIALRAERRFVGART